MMEEPNPNAKPEPNSEPDSTRRHHGSRHRRKRQKARWRVAFDPNWWGALVVFGLLVVLAPLLFGAVDRVVQLVLVVLLTAGVLLTPPAWPRLTRSERLFLVGVAGLLLLKEVAPALCFGHVAWRGELGVPLPWTHHPEPARVFDTILVGLVTVVWFQWVRTLASDGERRVWMAWFLAGAGAILAMVCFMMKADPTRPTAIYGIRETEGWIGWGPFPNRNHTSSFLAMAAVCLAGCLWWAAAKRKRALAVCGGLALALTLGALLAGKSRGGLLAFGSGLVAFLALVMWRKRDKRTIVVSLSVLAVAGALLATFGGKVMERFSSEAGVVSSDTRVLIWRETLGMWKDAPLFGHGVETFSQLFPLYQHADLDGKTVLHPESSWLQWLAELGVVPVALLAGALGCFLARQLRAAWPQRRVFFLTAGLFAGAVALLAHALIDVPGHRWATAGFALALLGVAFPIAPTTPGREAPFAPRRLVLVPAGIAVFWALPFGGLVFSWSVLAPTMLLNRETRAGGQPPTLAEWDAVLRWYPLDPWVRQFAGQRALEQAPQDHPRWERDFAAVRQLSASNWRLAEMQAVAVGRAFPKEAIPLWQDAIARAGREWRERLRGGVVETKAVPGARVRWAQYIQEHPAYALAYAQILTSELKKPDADVRAFFDIWWEQCALGEVTDEDAAVYYGYAARWSNPVQLEAWMRAHATRRKKDYAAWATLLHGWKNDQRAWEIYSGVVSLPEITPPSKGATRESLEQRLRGTADNAIYELELVHLLDVQGDHAAATSELLHAASRPDAPARVLREAAYRLASDGRLAEAVAMGLREKPRVK